MPINKVVYGNTTLLDLTSDTVTAAMLMQGYTAHDRTGAVIIGTAMGGGVDGDNIAYGIATIDVVGYAVVGTAVIGSESMVGSSIVGSAKVGG